MDLPDRRAAAGRILLVCDTVAVWAADAELCLSETGAAVFRKLLHLVRKQNNLISE